MGDDGDKRKYQQAPSEYVCKTIEHFELWQQGDLENPLHTHTLARSHL